MERLTVHAITTVASMLVPNPGPQPHLRFFFSFWSTRCDWDIDADRLFRKKLAGPHRNLTKANLIHLVFPYVTVVRNQRV